MVQELKDVIDASVHLIVTASEAIGDIGKMTPAEAEANIKFDMARFAMYLSASDGEIKYEEARAISDYFDFSATPEQLAEVIRELNIYSTEFETTPPASLTIVVECDNLFYRSNNGQKLDIWGCESVLGAYRMIAEEIVNIDGCEDISETIDSDIYLKMMEEYIDKNLMARNSGVSGFIKSTGSISNGSVPAPVKSGVSAPKKS